MTAPEQPGKAEDVAFVAREGSWAGLFSGLGAGGRLINSVILARLLGKDQYGLFNLASYIINIVEMPANLGLPLSTVHFVAASSGARQWDRLRWVVRTAFRLVLSASIVWMVLVWLGAPWGAKTYHKEDLTLPLAGLALILPLLGFNAIATSVLQGLKRVREKVFLDRIAHPLAFMVLLLAGGFFFRSISYVLVCFGLATVVVFFLSARWLHAGMKTVPEAPAPSPPPWRELLSYSTPVMFLNLLSQFLLKADTLVLGLYCSNAELGLYNAASRLGGMAVNLPTEGLNSSLAPSYASLHGRGDRAGLAHTFHTSTRWIFSLSALIFLGLVFAGKAALWFFGRDFLVGHALLCIMAAGQLASAAMGTNGMLLMMTGHPRMNLINSIGIGLLNFGLLFLLIPQFRGIGAAAAAAVCLALINAIRCVEIWFLYRIVPWDRTFLKPLAAFLTGGATGVGALLALGPVAAALIAVPAYLLVWWLAGPEPEDLELLRKFRARLPIIGAR